MCYTYVSIDVILYLKSIFAYFDTAFSHVENYTAQLKYNVINILYFDGQTNPNNKFTKYIKSRDTMDTSNISRIISALIFITIPIFSRLHLKHVLQGLR